LLDGLQKVILCWQGLLICFVYQNAGMRGDGGG
jgi:hypothetical protein